MNFTYNLIFGGNLKGFGYEIFKNDKIFIRQEGLIYAENNIMNEITAEQLAKLVTGKLNNLLSAFITEEEELELSTSVVTDSRIEELVQNWSQSHE